MGFFPFPISVFKAFLVNGFRWRMRKGITHSNRPLKKMRCRDWASLFPNIYNIHIASNCWPSLSFLWFIGKDTCRSIMTSYLVPSRIQYLTTPGFGFSFKYVGEPAAPLLNTRVPEVSSATDVLLSRRSCVKPNLGMRLPTLLFSSQESNFLTILTLVCLSQVERNV